MDHPPTEIRDSKKAGIYKPERDFPSHSAFEQPQDHENINFQMLFKLVFHNSILNTLIHQLIVDSLFSHLVFKPSCLSEMTILQITCNQCYLLSLFL